MRLLSVLAASAALLSRASLAINVDFNSPSSIKAAASSIAHGMMSWYMGNQTGQVPGYLTPGLVPSSKPFYWWEGGAMMGVLIDYWYYTGDSSYNDIVTQALLFQVGPTQDYMPPNQTASEGNDDQVFWAFSAMTAAEYKFPNPPSDQPQWLALAQGVWNSQQLRWDTTYCNGGLRWQIYSFNNGFNYKNTPSNGGFMNLGARLYAYTGNETYAIWVNKTWDWLAAHHVITDQTNPPAWRILDGTYTDNNCAGQNPIQWSYNVAMLLNAAAVMWNVTQDQLWADRANNIWDAARVFFKNQIMIEAACEPYDRCNNDQLSFKAYLSRFMAASTKWMPSLYDQFQPYLAASAAAAAQQCSGDALGITNACGFRWTQGATWDGTYGWGQQMGAMEVIMSQLIQSSYHPVTAQSGGISKGNPGAGTQGDGVVTSVPVPLNPITTADKAGAGVVTAVVLVAWLGLMWWMVV